MASKSERSFGSRVEKANKLKIFISGFNNYHPDSGEFSVDDLQQAITLAETLNPQVEAALYKYRQEVAKRRVLYINTPSSIKRTITPINSFFRAKFGKNSSQYLATKALVAKIRGVKIKTQKATDEQTHSVSQQSYGSILLNFKNLITDIETLGAIYNPTNDAIKLVNLLSLKNQAEASNDFVSQAFGVLTPAQTQRQQAFDQHSAKALRIKDFVQSQYGIDSAEYKLVKGLNI